MGSSTSKSVRGIDPKPIPVTSLRYRPKDYFGRHDLQTTLLTRVKGTMRRRALRDALEAGQITEVPESIKSAALSDVTRQFAGSLHPAYMGGEYLPTALESEIEIARIRIDSTTGDVTSLYARLVGQRIAYRIVDEYGGDTLSEPTQRSSLKPLTMGQMIDFFLNAWDLFDCLDANFEGDQERMLGFFEGESEFYPCFNAELRRRVREKFPVQPDDKED